MTTTFMPNVTGTPHKFFWLVAISASLWNVGAWLHWDPIFIMNDGIQYLSTAGNWLLGQGFSTNALTYNPHFQGQLPAPQTVWPPGLPALQVALGSIGVPLQTAALLINFVATAMSALFVYLILTRCKVSALAAAVSAALFYFSTSSWHLALALLSEPLFTCLVLAALYTIPSTAKHGLWSWVLCGTLIGASITVRYSGVFTAAAFGVGLAAMLLFTRAFSHLSWTRKFGRLCLYAVMPVLAFGGLMLRTQSLVGSINRDTGVGTSKSVIDTIKQFAEQASVMTGFRDGWLFSGDADTWLFFAFIFLTGIAVLLSVWVLWTFNSVQSDNGQSTAHLPSSQPPLPAADSYTSAVLAITILHAAAFGGYLAWCSLSSSPLNITSRYLFQIYPGLFVAFSIIVGSALTTAATAQGRVSTAESTATRPLLFTTGSLALLYLIAQVNLIPVINEYSIRATDARDTVNLRLDEKKTVADVVRDCVGGVASPDDNPPTSLWSNEGIPLHLNTGVHTITLDPIYTTSDFDFAQLASDIDEYNIGMFVFINNPLHRSNEFGEMLTTIKKWLQANGYPELSLPNATLPSGNSVNIYHQPGCV